MVQLKNFAGMRDVQIRLSREEFVSDMMQSSNDAAMKDVTTKP